jgi:hypothetical protein
LTPRARLDAFWDEPAFLVLNAEYARLDVALAAMARGEWAAFERQLAHGLAALARAEAEDLYPSPEALDDAAAAFRYERDLLAASEINDWLERCGLSVDDWTSYLARDLLRRQWHDALDHTLDWYPPSPDQLVAAAFAEGVCSGAFDDFEETCAARVALASSRPLTVDVAPAGSEDVSRVADAHPLWLSARARDDVHVRLERVLTIEARFARAAHEVVAQTSLDDVVEQHRMQWQQVELDTLQFPTEHAAREAVLCVTLDRLSLHDVAALSRRPASRSVCFADELEPERRDQVLGVAPGSVLGPLAVNGHFEVSAVVRRTSPTLADQRVLDRARRTVLDSALRRATRDHVSRPSRP